jgi:hypothetical protein
MHPRRRVVIQMDDVALSNPGLQATETAAIEESWQPLFPPRPAGSPSSTPQRPGQDEEATTDDPFHRRPLTGPGGRWATVAGDSGLELIVGPAGAGKTTSLAKAKLNFAIPPRSKIPSH